MKQPVGYTPALAGGRTHLLEPLLVCETPEKVQSVLKEYLKLTPLRCAKSVNLQIIECPAGMALACLTRKNNVYADVATQALLRQNLARIKRMFDATYLIDFGAALYVGHSLAQRFHEAQAPAQTNLGLDF